ncbi:MAG: hypothetical protein ACK4NM_10185 [Hydrogenophaga sp.]
MITFTDGQLLMPRLGEAVEPAHREAVVPWWRGLNDDAPPVRPAEAPALARELPWPLD